MKKLLTLVSVLVIAFALLCMQTFAVENLLTGDWKKGTANGDINKSKDADGMIVYSIGGLNAAYMSPQIDVYGAIKQVIGDQDDATVTISFDARVEFKAGISDEDKAFMGTPVMRAGKISADANASDPTSFADLYEGSLFKKIDAINIIGSGFASPIQLDETWEHYVVTFDVFADDLSDGIFDQWNFCLSSCKGFDSIEKLMFRNTGVYAGDDDGQATPVPVTPTPSPTPEATAVPQATEAPSGNAPTATANSGSKNNTDNKNGTDPGATGSVKLKLTTAGVVALCGMALLVVLLIAAEVFGFIYVKKRFAQLEKNNKE